MQEDEKKEKQNGVKGRTKGVTDQKVVPSRAILEPKTKRKISNNEPVFIYLKFLYFVHHGFLCVNIDLKIYCSKILFILITEFVGISLNFMPK